MRVRLGRLPLLHELIIRFAACEPRLAFGIALARGFLAVQYTRLLVECHLINLARSDRRDQVFGEVLHHQRSEEHTSELQSLMRNSYAVFCLNKKMKNQLYIAYVHYIPQTQNNNQH